MVALAFDEQAEGIGPCTNTAPADSRPNCVAVQSYSPGNALLVLW